MENQINLITKLKINYSYKLRETSSVFYSLVILRTSLIFYVKTLLYISTISPNAVGTFYSFLIAVIDIYRKSDISRTKHR